MAATEPIALYVPEDDNETLLPPPPDLEDQDTDDDGPLGATPPSYVRVGSDATTYARAHRWIGRAGLCLRWVRTCLGVAGGVYNANAAWAGAWDKHTSSPPREGAPVFYAGGNHGHVTLAASPRSNWSTDVFRSGQADLVSLGAIPRSWGYRYLGWTESLNGVRVLPDGIIIDASQVQAATRKGARYVHGSQLKKWVWAEVKGRKGAKRMLLSSKRLGPGFRANARIIQQRAGVRGPFDGLLGVTSLNWVVRRQSNDADVVS